MLQNNWTRNKFCGKREMLILRGWRLSNTHSHNFCIIINVHTNIDRSWNMNAHFAYTLHIRFKIVNCRVYLNGNLDGVRSPLRTSFRWNSRVTSKFTGRLYLRLANILCRVGSQKRKIISSIRRNIVHRRNTFPEHNVGTMCTIARGKCEGQ